MGDNMPTSEVTEEISLHGLLEASMGQMSRSTSVQEISLEELEADLLADQAENSYILDSEQRKRAESLESLKPSPISALKLDADIRKQRVSHDKHNDSVDIELEMLIKESEELCRTFSGDVSDDARLEDEVNALLDESIQLGRQHNGSPHKQSVGLENKMISDSEGSTTATDEVIADALERAALESKPSPTHNNPQPSANAEMQAVRDRIAQRMARREKRQKEKLNKLLATDRWGMASESLRQSRLNPVYETALRAAMELSASEEEEESADVAAVEEAANNYDPDETFDRIVDILDAADDEELDYKAREEKRLKALGEYFSAGETITRIQNRKMRKMKEELNKQYMELASERQLSAAYADIGLKRKESSSKRKPKSPPKVHPLVSAFRSYLKNEPGGVSVAVQRKKEKKGSSSSHSAPATRSGSPAKDQTVILKFLVQERRLKREDEFKQGILEREKARHNRIAAKSARHSNVFQAPPKKKIIKKNKKEKMKKKKKLNKKKKKKKKKKRVIGKTASKEKMFVVTVSKRKPRRETLLNQSTSLSDFSNGDTSASEWTDDVVSLQGADDLKNNLSPSDSEDVDLSGFVEKLSLDDPMLNFSKDMELEQEIGVKNSNSTPPAPSSFLRDNTLMNDTLLPAPKPNLQVITADLLAHRPGDTSGFENEIENSDDGEIKQTAAQQPTSQNNKEWRGQFKVDITEVSKKTKESGAETLHAMLSTSGNNLPAQQQTEIFASDPAHTFVTKLIEAMPKAGSIFSEIHCERVMRLNLETMRNSVGLWHVLYYVAHPQELLDVAFHGIPASQQVYLFSHLGAANHFYIQSNLYRAKNDSHRFRVMLVMAKKIIRMIPSKSSTATSGKNKMMNYRGGKTGKKYKALGKDVIPMFYIQYTMTK